MRALIGVVVVLVTLWSGYWFVGSRGVEAGLAAWIDARRAEGWVAEYSDISTIGYPNRFDTTISDLALADPATGLAWNMPFFQILTLSYTPNHIIAVFPGNRLEGLKGKRRGQHSIRVNDQYRICFVWRDNDAEQVEIVDYH